jgi:orotate phosphoribosyltransferase
MGFDNKEFVDFALENSVIGFSETPFVLSSGGNSCWYVNWRSVAEDVYLINRLAEHVIDFIKSKDLYPPAIVGVPAGATKLGIITQNKWARMSLEYGLGSHSLPMLRELPKRHGANKDRYFLGRPRDGSVLLEDVTTTAKSLSDCVVKLHGEEIYGLSTISLTDRSGGVAEKQLGIFDVPFYAMTTALDLVPGAFDRLRPGYKVARMVEKEFAHCELGEISLVN